MYVLPRRERRLVEENPCHLPGGQTTGGQFGPKGANGCATGQPVLTDQKTGQAKFDLVPPPVEKHGLQVERPGGPKGAVAGEKHGGITSFEDSTDDGADAALEALGVHIDAREIAAGMVSAITDEKFRVTVSTESGYEGSESYDGPDPSDVQSDYDEWSSERMSEAGSEAYSEQRGQFVSASEDAYMLAGDAINRELPEERLLDGAVWDKPQHEMSEAERSAYDHSLALAEKIFDPEEDSVINEEGLFQRQRGPGRVDEIVGEYLEDNPDAKFLVFPRHSDAPGINEFDTDYRTERSKYFNDKDGFENWIDDGHEQSALDDADIDSFDTWYENQYGHSPDKYGEGGSGGYTDDVNVQFEFTGNKGSNITRTFSMRDGELHVHHDYFTAANEGGGLAKQLFQGSLPMYDRMGVQSISTLANIDVGSYAWARFGFTADAPRTIARQLEARGDRMFRSTGLFDDGDWDNFTHLLDGGKSDSFIWDVVDAKFYTTPEKAKAFINQIGTQYISSSVGGRKALDEAAKGVVSVGRLLMVDSDISWSGTLDLHDEESVKRLEGYVGVWREGRAGLRSEPTPAPPSGPRTPDPLKSSERANKAILARSNKMAAQRKADATAANLAALNKRMKSERQAAAVVAKVERERRLQAQVKRSRTTYNGPTPQTVIDYRRPIGPTFKAGRQRASKKIAYFQDYNIKVMSRKELARRKGQGY